MGYALVPGTGWGMMSVETWSYLSAPSRGFRQTLLLLLILGVIVPAAVVTVGVRRITRDSYAQLEQTVTARTRELAVLNRVATVASGSLEIERILQDSLDQTVEATAMECGAAFRIDETSPSLEMVAQLALSPRQIAVLSDLPVASTIGVWAGHALEPRVWSVADLPEGTLRDGLAEGGLSCVVGIPLVAKDRTVGLLALGSRDECMFATEDLALLEGVGRQVGMAVDNARLYEESERTATAAERSRLARDLHDAVSQTLFSAALIAEVLPRIWERNPDEGRRRLEELRRLTRGRSGRDAHAAARAASGRVGRGRSGRPAAAVGRGLLRARPRAGRPERGGRLLPRRPTCRWRSTGSPRRHSTTWPSMPRPSTCDCVCHRRAGGISRGVRRRPGLHGRRSFLGAPGSRHHAGAGRSSRRAARGREPAGRRHSSDSQLGAKPAAGTGRGRT